MEFVALKALVIRVLNNNDFGRLAADPRMSILGHAAFRLLIRTYQSKLYSIAYGITLDREESLDIVQDVFLKVHQKIHTFREESSLSTWLHRITVNLCLNWKRRWTRRFRWHHQPLERQEGGDYPQLGTSDAVPETLYEKKELKEIVFYNAFGRDKP